MCFGQIVGRLKKKHEGAEDFFADATDTWQVGKLHALGKSSRAKVPTVESRARNGKGAQMPLAAMCLRNQRHQRNPVNMKRQATGVPLGNETAPCILAPQKRP